MSIVLARKYRPQSFKDFVGQEHVVRALTNALTNQRLHHAYLFTGTRGVGKTTLGRIIAKCLNCQQGISATPCGTCSSCQDITNGCAVDLIEIDAASNTRVEDTRDLLNNVQYAPTRDRFKIYLIDEVHMLSGHSFNALLKTLEEPPEHVKFILATTDPQKLPITVLSRCLQFHLKNMLPEIIIEQLQHVCQQENVAAEPAALQQLAQAANGSMRDGLSLLDQAIAYGDQQLTETDVRNMLGIVADEQLFTLLDALAQHNGQALIESVRTLVQNGADCLHILESLLSLLQQLAVAQLVPDTLDVNTQYKTTLLKFATQFTKEEVQLLYQIALIGRRDIQWAATPRSGLEMILLRMLTFTLEDKSPQNKSNTNTSTNTVGNAREHSLHKNGTLTSVPYKTNNQQPTSNQQPTEDRPHESGDSAQKTHLRKSEDRDKINWNNLIQSLNLSGITLVLAQHCELKAIESDRISLQITPAHAAIANDKQKQRLQEALSHHFGKPMRIEIAVSATVNSPAFEQQRIVAAEQQLAKTTIENDPNVQLIMQQFGAKLDLNSIKGV